MEPLRNCLIGLVSNVGKPQSVMDKAIFVSPLTRLVENKNLYNYSAIKRKLAVPYTVEQYEFIKKEMLYLLKRLSSA